MRLRAKDRDRILDIIKTSNNARIIYRANSPNLRAKELILAEVADFLEITSRTVFNIEQNYEEYGLDRALHNDPRPGAQSEFDDRVKSQIIALVCSDPPEGFDRWTMRLLQEKVIRKGIFKSISYETIRVILEEHDQVAHPL